MRTTRMECGSARTGPLATGCEHCLNGSKMVLFVTGLCDSGCFYCPVSFERKDKDAVYADEMLVSEEDDIIEEAVSIGATGTGITGGDPLLNIDRTVSFIRMLRPVSDRITTFTFTQPPWMPIRPGRSGMRAWMR